MELLPTDEQEQIVEAARVLLAKELPVDHQRWEPGPLAARDRTLLPVFAELGWFALGLAEERGGLGLGAIEDMLSFRETGRHLVTPILLAGVVAARIAPPALVERILAGTLRVGLAIPHGDAVYLIDAADADAVLLIDETVTLYGRDAFAEVRDVRGIDGTVTFQAATAPHGAPLAADDGTAAIYFSLLVAAMLCGAAEAVRDLTVTHASERSQFGQKIGTFQAVSHPLADMAVRCESAFAQVKYAAVTVAQGRGDAAFHVAAARIVAVQAAVENARASIQLHGGMGFAAEYPVHLFLKRAHLLDQLGGRVAVQIDRLMAMAPA